MSEHLIHLRRAWEGTFVEGGAKVVRRVDLPASWPADLSTPFLLSRAFQRPPIEPDRERLLLRFASVSGLISVHWNGQELARPMIGTADLELALERPIPARNLLALEVDPAGFNGLGIPWGTIALVIRSN
ncbi:MAG: hypothetical protein ABI353_18915 [Isosphaeraceae bacterium]